MVLNNVGQNELLLVQINLIYFLKSFVISAFLCNTIVCMKCMNETLNFFRFILHVMATKLQKYLATVCNKMHGSGQEPLFNLYILFCRKKKLFVKWKQTFLLFIC